VKIGLTALSVIFLSASQLDAQFPESITKPIVIVSRSGQFAIHGLPSPGGASTSLKPSSDTSSARLDPALLSFAAENTKQALLATLGLTDRWQGRITISLQPVSKDNEEILIAAVHYSNGWQYQMRIPEQVDKARLTKALVEALLLEIAHRNSDERRLELPPWLVPGLGAYLTATAPTPLIVEPESLTTRKQRMDSGLKQMRERLRKSGGLTLDQLNWPDSSTDPAQYEASAHLFVHELLRKDGGVFLSTMLARLPDHLNWQTAFLRAFNFRSLREVDKWWALQLVQFAGRETRGIWSPAEIRAHLDEILATPIEVRHDRDQLPMTVEAPLQQILEEWEFNRQAPILRQKLNRLEALGLRASGLTYELVRDYHRALAEYLDRRNRLRSEKSRAAMVAVADTIIRLNQLDLKREVMVAAPPGTPVLSGTPK
jgi:hypothetical protein